MVFGTFHRIRASLADSASPPALCCSAWPRHATAIAVFLFFLFSFFPVALTFPLYLGFALYFDFRRLRFWVSDVSFGCCGFFWEGFSGFLVGFGSLSGWGALRANLGVFREGFDRGIQLLFGI
jgi:hypothetical protein